MFSIYYKIITTKWVQNSFYPTFLLKSWIPTLKFLKKSLKITYRLSISLLYLHDLEPVRVF